MFNDQHYVDQWRLPEKFRKDWIRALKSDKYEQTQGALCEISDANSSYCALGVACKVLGYADEDLDGILGFSSEDKWNDIPNNLKDRDELTGMIVQMNDDEYLDFNRIADWIREATYSDE